MNSIKCPVCQRCYSNKWNMNRHRLTKHDDASTVASEDSQQSLDTNDESVYSKDREIILRSLKRTFELIQGLRKDVDALQKEEADHRASRSKRMHHKKLTADDWNHNSKKSKRHNDANELTVDMLESLLD